MAKSGDRAQVHLYESEYWAITSAASQFQNIETGGDLFGSFTHGNMPVIWLASGPGPRVRRSNTHFAQDTAFTTEWQKRLKKEFGIQYIGSWHSHHRLHLRTPSDGDVEAAQSYARNHSRNKTLEIIVTYEENDKIVLWPYFYPNAQNARNERWVATELVYLSGESPLRARLGADERLFSGGVDWRAGSYTNRTTEHSGHRAASDVEDNIAVDIPDKIANELVRLEDRLINADQPSNTTFVASMMLDSGQHVEAYINLNRLIVERLVLVNITTNTRSDITNLALHEKLPMALDARGGTLQDILSKLPYVLQRYKMKNVAASTTPATPFEQTALPVTYSGTQTPPALPSKGDVLPHEPAQDTQTSYTSGGSREPSHRAAGTQPLPGTDYNSQEASATSLPSGTIADSTPNQEEQSSRRDTATAPTSPKSNLPKGDAQIRFSVIGQGTYELFVSSSEGHRLGQLEEQLAVTSSFIKVRRVLHKSTSGEIAALQIVAYAQSDIEGVLREITRTFTQGVIDKNVRLPPAEEAWFERIIKNFFAFWRQPE